MAATDSTAPRGFTLRQWLILATVQLSTLLFGMTITVANVVLPQIKGALSATQDQVAWVVTFNLVATAIVTPMTGWLAARLGWRRLMVTALTGFVVTSLACGLATSLEQLVLFRVAQGAFGAPLMPLGQAMLLASFPRHQHPLVLMAWGIGGVFGPVLGPMVGGAVAEALDWRWVFYMIVPFGVAAVAMAAAALRDEEREPGVRLDWIGFAALSVAIGAAQLVISRGQRLDWFESSEIVLETVAAVLGAYVFVARSLTAGRPLFDPRMFLDRNFAIGLLVVFVMGMLSYTPIVLFPPLLQELRGYPDDIVGYLIAGRGLGNWVSFLIVVQCTRLDARSTLAAGFAFQALAGWWMTQLNINLTSAHVFWLNLLQGFGFGLAYTPLATLAFATLEVRHMTPGSGLFNLVRHFGSSVFISASILVLVHTAAQSYDHLRGAISPFNELFAIPGLAGRWSLESPAGISGVASEVQRQALMIGYVNAFYLFTIVALAGVPLAYVFERVRPAPSSAAAD